MITECLRFKGTDEAFIFGANTYAHVLFVIVIYSVKLAASLTHAKMVGYLFGFCVLKTFSNGNFVAC